MARGAARVSCVRIGARVAVVAIAMGGALVFPGFGAVARAQTPSEIAVAKQWFSDGLAHEEKGEFAPALDLFRRAAQVKRTPQIVYHVGFCESRTGALVEALVDLDAATAIARAAHADDVVSAAQSELADVKKRVPTLEARLKGDPSTATRFVVDGSAIALSVLGTAMPLDPGEHTVTIELASGARVTGKATLAEREAKVVELVALEAPSPAAAPVPAPAPAPPPTSVPVTSSPSAPPMTEHRASTIEWVAIGVGAALTVGGASFFAAARVKEGSLNTACPSHTGCDPSLQGSYDTATTFNSVGLGLGAVGLATAALGVSVLVLRPSATTSTAIVVSPRGVGLTTSF